MGGTPQPGSVEYGQVNQRFKTQKCRHFENKGFCQWNENCQYAHGDGELRDINDPIPEHMRMQVSGTQRTKQAAMAFAEARVQALREHMDHIDAGNRIELAGGPLRVATAGTLGALDTWTRWGEGTDF